MAGAGTLAAADTAAAAATAARAETATARARTAELRRQIEQQEMAAEELATTREAKQGMVASLQDSWSGRAAECGTKVAAPPSPARRRSDGQSSSGMSGTLRGVRAMTSRIRLYVCYLQVVAPRCHLELRALQCTRT